MSTPFKFKQFEIAHDKCAMKVGVDGVILGAYARVTNPCNILDIGTGSGLIALMLQQAYPNSDIYALEPNEVAFEQAKANFNQSPFRSNPYIIATTLQDFTPAKRFDLIVCNPPFYKENVSSQDANRDQARMSKFLPLSELIQKAKQLLSNSGYFYFIYPSSEEEKIDNEIKKAELYTNSKLYIYPKRTKNHNRIIYKVSKHILKFRTEELIIETARHDYTKDYITLTKPYYLNF